MVRGGKGFHGLVPARVLGRGTFLCGESARKRGEGGDTNSSLVYRRTALFLCLRRAFALEVSH